MIRIRVLGLPAPQGSKTRGANGGMRESSKAVAPWREAIRAETQRAEPLAPPRGLPVAVRIRIYLPRPGGHYGTGRNAETVRPGAPARPTGKPDLDKLERACLDGLVAGAALHDDACVTWLQASKDWSDDRHPPGAIIEIDTDLPEVSDDPA